MDNFAGSPAATISAVDTLMYYGMALEHLGMALYNRPEVEVRYCNGLLTFWRNGEEVYRGGYLGLEPDAYNWRDWAVKASQI